MTGGSRPEDEPGGNAVQLHDSDVQEACRNSCSHDGSFRPQGDEFEHIRQTRAVQAGGVRIRRSERPYFVTRRREETSLRGAPNQFNWVQAQSRTETNGAFSWLN